MAQSNDRGEALSPFQCHGCLLSQLCLFVVDSEHAIKFGDQIYIQCQHADSITRFIEGQGMMSNGVAVVTTPVPCYGDCLFQVCVRARVSAAEELNVSNTCEIHSEHH